eukprot:CCRYP_003161-RA/>CCRYP_003161-RA protein AED:0.28 eAED:0.28 QI:0/0/0/1/1/1/2/0/561
MVMVDIDSSAILVEPIKNCTDPELTPAYSSLIARLHRAGVVPRKHVLDNEVSNAMKNLITDTYKMTYELVPPGCHCSNAAEVALRNFKSHFLSILAGIADNFPMKLWDKLLPQAEITINLLRQSNTTPTVSTYAHLNGPFNYNKMPLAPMGCRVQVHEKSDAHGTWAFHSIDGWYLSTSPEHYHTHRCHIESTNSDRLSNTVVFQHKSITHPSLTPTDKLMQAVCACAAALKGITAPTKEITDLKALLDITATTSPIPTTSHTADGVPRVLALSNPPSLPRVPPTNDTASSQVACSMTNRLNQLPPAPVAIPTPRPATKPKQRKLTKSAAVPDSAPARNTRSHTMVKAKLLAAPATNTCAKCISRIPKPVPILSTCMKRVDTEVHRALAVMDQDTGKLLNYRTLLQHPAYPDNWTKSSANEFGRLANVNSCAPYGRKIKEPNRTRLVVGGDRINYPGEVTTPTANMLAAKILFNSVISTAAARLMTMDISNFYLNTPLQHPEYIRMKLTDIPEEIINEYKLRDLVEPDDCVYIIIILGMYGLPHAGLIANELLKKRLNKHG